VPWNKGTVTGQKPPLKRNEIWAIRVHLQLPGRVRDLALFNLAIGSKLRKAWVADVGLDPKSYGTHSLRRTKATLIYRRTKNLRAVQLLLGHSKIESTVRYLGIELDDALEIAEQTEI
jgi:integrase